MPASPRSRTSLAARSASRRATHHRCVKLNAESHSKYSYRQVAHEEVGERERGLQRVRERLRFGVVPQLEKQRAVHERAATQAANRQQHMVYDLSDMRTAKTRINI